MLCVLQQNELKKQGITGIEYHLAGSGKPEKFIALAKSLHVEDQVKIYGSLPHEKIFSWLDHIDVYIQPSFTESLGRSVVEAMSIAVPAACARVGGMLEYASKDIMFTPGNVREICEVMKKLLSPEVREREAKKSFAVAHEFDKKKLDAERDKFYSEFTGVKNYQQSFGG